MALRGHFFFMKQLTVLLLLQFPLWLFCPAHAIASSIASLDLAAAARSPTWQRLLHYQKDLWGAPVSAIHSADFFLSERGRSDPLAELEATVSAMLEPVPAGQSDGHAKCRFPARRMWLDQQFPGLSEAFAETDCPALRDWLDLGELGSISVVFANGYLGNPASYYGHLFLKFNTSRGTRSYLIEQTANFGAIDTTGDNPAVYIVKALTGGYDGGFSPVDFFFHGTNYGENELRDLWEYELALPVDVAKFIAAHAWEVNKKRYTYYFFHDNCAFRAVELLEVADGVSAVPHGAPWIIPQGVLQTMRASRYGDKPLVARRIYHPSRQSRLYQRFSRLEAEPRSVLARIVDGEVGYEDSAVRNLPLEQQYSLLDTALDYFQYHRGDTVQEGERRFSKEYVQALSARMRLPPAKDWSDFVVPEPPDTGLPPGWIQFGWAVGGGQGPSQMLRVRPVYYDVLDASPAQATYGGLSMGDFRLEARGGKVRVSHLDLVAVHSVKPSVTGLPADGGVGWRLKFGWERERLTVPSDLVARLQADALFGTLLGTSATYAYASLGGALQEQGHQDGMGFTRGGLGLMSGARSGLSWRVSAEWRKPFAADASAYDVAVGEARLPIGKESDIRLLWERDVRSRLMLGLGFYW